MVLPSSPVVSWKLRVANIEDALTIRQIAEAAWRVTYRDIISPEFMAHELEREYCKAALLEQMTSLGHRFLLLENPEDDAAGFISYSVEETTATVHKLYLRPDLKGKGGGAALMTQIEADLYPLGCRSIELKVNRSNPAVGFYQKQGFEIVCHVDTQVGNGFLRTDYLMRKASLLLRAGDA